MILIVDDSLTVRMDLAEALIAAGFAVVPVGTLADARAALRDKPIVLAILDVRLPDGDGIALLEELRHADATAQLPVLMLSSEGEVKDRIRGLRTGANDYLGKPYDTSFVIARVRELAGRDAMRETLVLLIDDSPTFRASIEDALRGAGFTTMTASSGIEGLRLAAAHRPAAIIVDGVMPGMDGATVIRRIRLDPVLRGTPCVLLTGSEDHASELGALEAGADAFVRKEGDLDAILARVGAVLRTARRAPARFATEAAGPRRILAVDDSPTFLESVGERLRDDGHDVVLAPSGEEALELLAVQDVDCILLDRLMPGLSGAETCERIKSSPVARDIPLIMLTALDGRDAMIDGLAVGADDFISKSSGLDVIAARVRAQLRRKQFEDEHRRVREQLLRSQHEAEEAQAVSQTRAAMNDRLEAANQELEAFSYSVSHDLRAPLRSIRAFSQALVEDCATQLDVRGQRHLERILSATERMARMIEDLLELSRVSRAELVRARVDIGAIARAICTELAAQHPARTVEVEIAPDLFADGDAGLLRTALENLISNAWKFTSRRIDARLEIGVARDGEPVYFVRDNGAGFDMANAERLFRPFQRLHTLDEFEGTGIGLATVQRVIARHGGRIWAHGEPDRGAAIFFTL